MDEGFYRYNLYYYLPPPIVPEKDRNSGPGLEADRRDPAGVS